MTATKFHKVLSNSLVVGKYSNCDPDYNPSTDVFLLTHQEFTVYIQPEKCPYEGTFGGLRIVVFHLAINYFASDSSLSKT